MRNTFFAVAALTVTGALAVIAGSTAFAAPGDVDTTVTITAEGTDLSGVVRSPAPRRCADERNVVVWKQVGTRGGGDDIRFASDTASLNGTRYEWSTGNTGTSGRFYAHVRRVDGCKADTSPTIRARR
jgi:hypothetical protein